MNLSYCRLPIPIKAEDIVIRPLQGREYKHATVLSLEGKLFLGEARKQIGKTVPKLAIVGKVIPLILENNKLRLFVFWIVCTCTIFMISGIRSPIFPSGS